MIAPTQSSLAAFLLYSCPRHHRLTPFTSPSSLRPADSFQIRLSSTQQIEEGTIRASAWSVLLRPEEFVEHLAQRSSILTATFSLSEHLTKNVLSASVSIFH